MSKYIATRAIRGANALVTEAELMLQKALGEKGPDTPVSFPNTAYYLPLILGMTGIEVTKLGDLGPVIEHARRLLHPQPATRHWTPYLGETLDSGMATLLAAEIIEAVRFVYGLQPEPMPGLELAGGTAYEATGNGHEIAEGHLNGPIDDIQLRSWGIQLVDGRMPGFAAIVGCAKSNKVAVQIVRELQKRNILTFLSGNVNGRSIIHQLMEEGVELGYDTYTVPFGTDTISAIYALGFATRSALTFGGLKQGQARDILLYNRARVFAFVLALGEVDDLKYAAAAGAINFGFPVIADTVIPEILPTGVTTYEHVVSMPWNEIPGKDDEEKSERLVQKCIEIRGVKITMHDVPVPVPYGSAFEGEVVRKNDMRVEFGGKYSRCFEYLHMVSLDSIADGVVELVGPDFSEVKPQGAMDMGIVVEVAGRKMQEDFEPVLERQMHYFINGASGIQHVGQRDITWIRISKNAAEKGFDLKHFGAILHARFHADFGAIVDKVKVTIYTEPAKVATWLATARKAYDHRNRRLANLTDSAVEEFYSCTLCQSFAPDHVCIVSPERLGLCGAYNWLDCKASYSINPTGPNQPIRLGKIVDPLKGYWEGTTSYAKIGSHGVIEKVSMYSIMENPMTACLTADTEVIVNEQMVRLGEFVDEWQKEDQTNDQVLTLTDQGRLSPSRLLGVRKNPAPPQLIRIETKSGQKLTLTPNHEVAADRWGQNGHGPWVRADELLIGDRVYALRHLRLHGVVPAVIDLLPDDYRLTDKALLAEVKAELRGRYGSLAAAYSALNLKQPDARVKSVPLDVLHSMVESLGWSWDKFKQRITAIAPPAGHPEMPLPELNPDFFYLLGLLASDGSLHRRGRYQCRVSFTNSDESLLAAFSAVYGRLFPTATLNRRQKSGGDMIDGRQLSATKPSMELYGTNFLLGLLADAFGVLMSGEQPWDMLRLVGLPETHIAAFLAGEFDGDGSVHLRQYDDRWPVGEACLRHSDEHAARHLQMLLKRLRIVSHLRGDRTAYQVKLYSGNLRRFAEQIPARHAVKRDTLTQIAALSKNGIDKTHEQILPFAAGKVLDELPESQIALSPSTRFCYKTGRSRPTADNVRAVIEEAPETAAILKPYLQNDFFLDTIIRIDTVESAGLAEHVFNLSLLDINSYIANGIHVKNCGCFECIVMVIPEVNGVMVVSREDIGMTPAGMKFSTLAGMAGGGIQTPGVMGVGKYYLISPKFISADGGFKRVAWMSSVLKETMADELRVVAEREGIPDLLDRIATGNDLTEVEDLVKWIEDKQHPVLDMPPMGLEIESEVASGDEAAEEAMPDFLSELESADELDVLTQAEAVITAAEDKSQAAAETVTLAQEGPAPSAAKSDNSQHEVAEHAMNSTPPPQTPTPSPDPAPLLGGTSDPLLEAQQAALRQAQALQQAQQEALRQAEALGRAREAGYGAAGGSA
ncbi:MAG: hypothetical protein GXP37_13965, partial [Chloroflexi bacterium]|nr:hypothetical protein [Chloroflexota bacterium]